MGCGETCMKIILGVINLIFLLAGALMLAFGITAKVDKQAVVNIFSTVLPSSSHEDLQKIGVDISEITVSSANFMIALGVITVVIAIFGFVGACCLIQWMLVVYAIVLIVLLVAEIALIIFAAVYNDTFKEKVQKEMYETLKDYKKGITVNETGQVIMATDALDLAWDGVQLKEQCCGAYNYTDFERAGWSLTVIGINAKVPVSCCKRKTDDDTPGSRDEFDNIQECLKGNEHYIHDNNCYESIEDFIYQYKFIAIGIAIGIIVIEVLLIIIAFVLCCRAQKDSKFV